MKKIITIIFVIAAILAVGILGQADYEEETIEVTHSQKARMPYWYE